MHTCSALQRVSMRTGFDFIRVVLSRTGFRCKSLARKQACVRYWINRRSFSDRPWAFAPFRLLLLWSLASDRECDGRLARRQAVQKEFQRLSEFYRQSVLISDGFALRLNLTWLSIGVDSDSVCYSHFMRTNRQLDLVSDTLVVARDSVIAHTWHLEDKLQFARIPLSQLASARVSTLLLDFSRESIPLITITTTFVRFNIEPTHANALIHKQCEAGKRDRREYWRQQTYSGKPHRFTPFDSSAFIRIAPCLAALVSV